MLLKLLTRYSSWELIAQMLSNMDNMNIFTSREKEAVSCLCLSMIAADGRIDNKEIKSWNLIKDELGIYESNIPTYSGTVVLKSLVVIKDMDYDKKVLVCQILNHLMQVDGEIDPSELELFNMVFESCGLKEIASRL